MRIFRTPDLGVEIVLVIPQLRLLLWDWGTWRFAWLSEQMLWEVLDLPPCAESPPARFVEPALPPRSANAFISEKATPFSDI